MDPENQAAPTPETPRQGPPSFLWIIIVLVVVVAGGAGFYFYMQTQKAAPAATDETVPSQAMPVTGSDAPETVVNPEGNPVEEPSSVTNLVVNLTPQGFSPANVAITTGTRITWTNQTTTIGNVSSSPHPSHTDYPALNLGDFAPGQSVTLVFTASGNYKYHNHLNPTQFGSVTVQ